MLKHKLQELKNEKIKEMSHFVGTHYEDSDLLEEKYLEQVVRKRNHFLNLIDDIKESNHIIMKKYHRDDLELAYNSIKSLDHNFAAIYNLEGDLNTPFYIYSIEGENYLSYEKLDINKIIEDPYSSEAHVLISKTWYSPELKKIAYNNKFLFIEIKTSLAECLLNRKCDIHNSEHISKVSNYLLELKRTGYQVFFDLDVGSEYRDSIKFTTNGIPSKSEIKIDNCLIKNSLLENSSFLNECLVRGYINIENDIAKIITLARDRIYYSEYDDDTGAKILLEPIRTFYLLLKHLDSSKEFAKREGFEKISYFYEMKSITKVYNKIFSNKEVMILYNKVEKEVQPTSFEMRQKQERIKKDQV